LTFWPLANGNEAQVCRKVWKPTIRSRSALATSKDQTCARCAHSAACLSVWSTATHRHRRSGRRRARAGCVPSGAPFALPHLANSGFGSPYPRRFEVRVDTPPSKRTLTCHQAGTRSRDRSKGARRARRSWPVGGPALSGGAPRLDRVTQLRQAGGRFKLGGR
jgi:hypothetical protein